MTATAHALVGGAIAASFQNPVLGITLSATSHPLLDMIPHWDAGWGWRQKSKFRLFLEASFDLSLGVFLAYILFGRNINFWYFLICVFASEIWDIMEVPYWFLNFRFPPFSWIYNLQSSWQGKLRLPWGILTQAATVILVVIMLQNFIAA